MLIHKTLPFFVKCLLMPSQAECLISLLLILLICRKGALAFKTLLFVAFCVVVNVALKVTFQVPSHMTTVKGYFAFPSGHMQFSTVFYGWIAYHLHQYSKYLKYSNDSNYPKDLKDPKDPKSSKSLKNAFEPAPEAIEEARDSLTIYLTYTLLTLILFSVGCGLVMAGYHSTIDVVGGWVVGTLLVISLGLIEIIMPRWLPILVALIATACMVYIPFQYAPIPQYAWWSYGTAILMSMLWIRYQKK